MYTQLLVAHFQDLLLYFLWNGIRRCICQKINFSISSDSFGRTVLNQILKNGDSGGKREILIKTHLLHHNCYLEELCLLLVYPFDGS